MKIEEKKQFVKNFEEEIQSSGSVIVASYQGINANAANVLRKELKSVGCTLKVVKNRLARRSLENAGKEKYEELFGSLKGPVAVILGSEDPSAGLKVFKNYFSENEILSFKAAIVGENFLDENKLKKLADLPDRTVLIAQVVNVFNAPIQNLHSVLSGVIKKLIYALKDLQEKKPEHPEQAAEEKQEPVTAVSDQNSGQEPAAEPEAKKEEVKEPAAQEKQQSASESESKDSKEDAVAEPEAKKEEVKEPAAQEKQQSASESESKDSKEEAVAEPEAKEEEVKEPAAQEKQQSASESESQDSKEEAVGKSAAEASATDIKEEDKDQSEKPASGDEEAPVTDTEKKEDSSNG